MYGTCRATSWPSVLWPNHRGLVGRANLCASAGRTCTCVRHCPTAGPGLQTAAELPERRQGEPVAPGRTWTLRPCSTSRIPEHTRANHGPGGVPRASTEDPQLHPNESKVQPRRPSCTVNADDFIIANGFNVATARPPISELLSTGPTHPPPPRKTFQWHIPA